MRHNYHDDDLRRWCDNVGGKIKELDPDINQQNVYATRCVLEERQSWNETFDVSYVEITEESINVTDAGEHNVFDTKAWEMIFEYGEEVGENELETNDRVNGFYGLDPSSSSFGDGITLYINQDLGEGRASRVTLNAKLKKDPGWVKTHTSDVRERNWRGNNMFEVNRRARNQQSAEDLYERIDCPDNANTLEIEFNDTEIEGDIDRISCDNEETWVAFQGEDNESYVVKGSPEGRNPVEIEMNGRKLSEDVEHLEFFSYQGSRTDPNKESVF